MLKTFTAVLFGLATPAVFAPSTFAGGAPVADPILFVCDEESSDPICNALTSALRHKAKDRPIKLVSQINASSKTSGLIVRFRQGLNEPDGLSGQFTWSSKDGQEIEGPMLELSISDKTLGPKEFDEFASRLLTATNIPF